MSPFIFLLIMLVILVGYILYNYFRQKKISTILSEEEFVAGYRKAQLIDLRENVDFKSGHILGARNIPLNQMKNYIMGMRKDQPIYLYCQNQVRSQRAASILYKAGFRNISVLSGGYKKWTGKIKK